jgi:hypothetical protein
LKEKELLLEYALKILTITKNCVENAHLKPFLSVFKCLPFGATRVATCSSSGIVVIMGNIYRGDVKN